MNDHSNLPFSLHSEVALVTGGSRGIGFAIASEMSRAGAQVVITGRNEITLREAASKIGENTRYFVHDITERDKASNLIEQIEQESGPISILVNNAGNHIKKNAFQTTDEEFDKLLSTHLGGAFTLSREAAKQMTVRRHGSILFIASMASYLSIPMVSGYSAAKSGVLGLVRSLSSEWSPLGIRVNAIAPGFIESDMLHNAISTDPKRREKIESRSLLGRFGKPEEIGLAAVYLCSPAGSFITGICLPVDGGVHTAF